MQVSIIMPYYNSAKYIKETVAAIIAQTYVDWELIIVDDCSPDPETQIVLGSVAEMDSRIRIMGTETNSGAGTARNIGIEAAQGRFLAFCDSDDWWYPTKLEEQLNFMSENAYPFTCTWYEDANEELEVYYTMRQPAKQSFEELLQGNNVGTPGVMIDTSILGKKMMPNMRRSEDWALWLTYLKYTEYLYTYPKALWKYRHISASESSNKWKMMTSVVDMYKLVVGYSTVRAWTYAMFVFLPKNIIKKLKKFF